MSECYIGEIQMFAFDFAPKGWSVCDGAELSVNQNMALATLLSDPVSGIKRTTFNLPDMRGRVPVYRLRGERQSGGLEAVTLSEEQLPRHSHPAAAATSVAKAFAPINGFPANAIDGFEETPREFWGKEGGVAHMSDGMLSSMGGGVPHSNMQPSRVLLFCIAMEGLFPWRNDNPWG